MKIAIRAAEVASVSLGVFLVYRFVVRPWRRERIVPFDGLLVLAALAVSLYDPLNSYFHPGFAYNSYFVNFGTAMVEVPGWQSFHEPGAQIAWPIFFIPPLYAAMFLGIVALACALMRKTRQRWPHLPAAAHIAICFVAMCLLDTALEGPVVMRLGFYEHTGWSIPFLDGYYGHNALKNILLVGVCLTATAVLRMPRNDRGETFVERGMHRLPAQSLKTNALRFLAVIASMQAILLFGYHAPVAVMTLINPHPKWHKNMQEKSFLNDRICGYGAPRSCPPD